MVVAAEVVGPWTFAALVALVVGLPLAARFTKRWTIGPVQVEMAERAVATLEKVSEVAAAVNNVERDEPKLIDQVRSVRESSDEFREEIATLARVIGLTQAQQRALAVTLTELTAQAEVNGMRLEKTAQIIRELDAKLDAHLNIHLNDITQEEQE